MSNFISTFQERFGDWLTARTALTIVSFDLIDCNFPFNSFGHLSSIRAKLADWVLQLAGVFQTIPSMALLGLFIPLMGIGTLPALTALVIYAIFPILQNTITGLWD